MTRDDDVFVFQAEDGIRDSSVTGVQTCALPICQATPHYVKEWSAGNWRGPTQGRRARAASRRGRPAEGGVPPRGARKIRRAACRGRGENSVVAGLIKKKKKICTLRQRIEISAWI